MLHKMRVFQVSDVESVDALTEKLTQHTWCGCNGFRLEGYLFLNDSFGGDGAQEYGVVKESTMQQVESITFSWCSREAAGKHIEASIWGVYDAESFCKVSNGIETPAEHGRCGHCA